MNKIKKGSIFIFALLFFLIFLSFLNTLGLDFNISKYIVKIIFGLELFIFNFKYTQKKEKNGYFYGARNGLIITLLFFILNLFLKNKINFTIIVYDVLIILISIMGSIFGINKKKDN